MWINSISFSHLNRDARLTLISEFGSKANEPRGPQINPGDFYSGRSNISFGRSNSIFKCAYYSDNC